MNADVPADTSTEVMKTSRKSFRNGKLAAALLAGKARRLQTPTQNPYHDSELNLLQSNIDNSNNAATDAVVEVNHSTVTNKVSRLPASMTKQLRLTRRKGNPT